MANTIITPTFIWNFKTGDNIIYNLSVLEQLYKALDKLEESDKKLLYKPIILNIVSITEAILYDFNSRIKKATREGVPPLTEQILEKVRLKNYPKLSHYIDCAEKYNLYDIKEGEDYYGSLRKLSDIRNRIHTQNEKKVLPLNESFIYTDDIKLLAERVLEYTMKLLSYKYPRFDGTCCYVGNFCLPWEPKFK